ncbi:APX6 [Scenedesmus sp. PABB004]|nr:APX6 [Scenedesmus sp. PABB004]
MAFAASRCSRLARPARGAGAAITPRAGARIQPARAVKEKEAATKSEAPEAFTDGPDVAPSTTEVPPRRRRRAAPGAAAAAPAAALALLPGAEARRRRAASPQVQQLLNTLVADTEIAEMELKMGSFQLKVRRSIDAPAPAPAPAVVAAPAPPAFAAAAAPVAYVSVDDRAVPEESVDEGMLPVTAPKVGVFRRGKYAAGKKVGKGNVANVGDTVKKGQTLGYVEQLGTFVELKAPQAGELASYKAEEGDPVEYGQVVVEIAPFFGGHIIGDSNARVVRAAVSDSDPPAPGAAPAGLGRRGLLLQLPSSALLAAGLGAWAAPPLGPGAPAASAAPAGPRALPPDAAAAVAKALAQVVTKPKAPVILRLAYHDAATYSAAAGDGGANASVRFELDRPENTGLKRGWRLIEQVADALKGTPGEGSVSYADLIALAGAHAVAVCGGPAIPVPVGRADAGGPDPPGRMASERAGVAALISNFADKGLGVTDLVALSGAHTLGGKGFGDPVTFDTAYYTALLAKPWLNAADPMAGMIGLPSDHALPDDPACAALIARYASDSAAFFADFAAAYAKLTALGAVWA